MSKRLLFFRHGKSDWDEDNGQDHERPVSERGRKAAKVMGEVLAKAYQVPDVVLTSSAVRARITCELAAAAGHWTCPIVVSEALYLTRPDEVLMEVRNLAATASSALLVGHEPTWSSTMSALIGGGQIRVPTGAIARLDFDVSTWKEIDFGLGELVWLLPPKFFTEGRFDFV